MPPGQPLATTGPIQYRLIVLGLDSRLAEEVCYRVSRLLVRRREAGDAGERASTFDEEAYYEWRAEELAEQFSSNFDGELLRGKDVVDFGCGAGDLSFFVTRFRPKAMLGIELDPEGVQMATDRAAKLDLPVMPTFEVAPDPDSIGLDDDACDVLMCFDVLEHIMSYERIIPEWRRVLRPGGRVMIWWSPWFHPYGPHIESLMPIPWAHAVFSERVLIDTCARIYEMPEYKPRIWDFDEAGQRKPNKWRAMDTLPEVNQLTMRDFEALVERTGFQIEQRNVRGFGGKLARVSRPLTTIPYVQEFFASYVTYQLKL